MALKLANNATGRLAVNISNADTALALQAGDGSKFPTLAAGDWFPITLVRPDGGFEIMYATAIAGDTVTVQRGKENTSPIPFVIGDRVELRATVGVFQSYLPLAGGTVDGDLTVKRTSAPTTGRVYLGSGGAYIEGSASALNFGANQIWHAGNFNPATKFDVAGGTMTGRITGATSSMSMSQDSGATMGSFVCRASGTGDANLAGMGFYNDNYAIKMGVRADGTFGLGGWSRAAWSWYSDPSGNMVAAGNVSAYSDPRLKDDIERIAGALDIIEQLDGVRFTWNNKTELIGKPGERDIGVLADQVEAVLPELVGRSIPDEANGGERWRVVAYDKLVPVLIEAVKDLSARVRGLEGR